MRFTARLGHSSASVMAVDRSVQQFSRHRGDGGDNACRLRFTTTSGKAAPAVSSLESLTATTGLAVVLFISTNIDDIVLLVAFLANPKFRTREVVSGQLGGIGALYAFSAVA